MHKNLCIKCGQYLDWNMAENMQTVYLLVNDDEEAGYWAGQYEIFHGTTYGINFESWRLLHKDYPLVLYFSFPSGKGYGRFMRKAAKEARVIKDFSEEFKNGK